MKHTNIAKLPKCFALFLLFTLISTFMVQFNVESARAYQKKITVPDEYSTMAEAVANARSVIKF
ncbi:hypothetical protein JW988_03080 [Candidatus Bathyarchaeota archaeon]|nr:hypothetical protein [Candidatus Bathyarchaeota archaeon]